MTESLINLVLIFLAYLLIGKVEDIDQKKFIGNAVHTSISKAWCPALCRALQESPSNQPRISNDNDV